YLFSFLCLADLRALHSFPTRRSSDLFYRPSGGSINFLGREVINWPVHRLARLGMARTFQTTHLFTDATVLDNLIVGYRAKTGMRSEEHTSELQSRENLVCRLLLEKKK